VEVARKLDRWLREIGFEVEDVDGGMCFWISNPAQWQLPLRL
jgi:hypothetical protein